MAIKDTPFFVHILLKDYNSEKFNKNYKYHKERSKDNSSFYDEKKGIKQSYAPSSRSFSKGYVECVQENLEIFRNIDKELANDYHKKQFEERSSEYMEKLKKSGSTHKEIMTKSYETDELNKPVSKRIKF